MKIVVEGIGPEDHWLGSAITRLSLRKPLAKTLFAESRDLPLGRNSCHEFCGIPQYGRLCEEIRERRSNRCNPRPAINVAAAVMIQRMHPAFVVVRKKLGLVGRNISSDGAIALTSLAGETKIERRLHVRVAPLLADYIAFGHLPKQVGAATSGVLFFASHAKAGTHHSAFELAALAHTHTAKRCLRQAAIVLGKFEMGFRLPGTMVHAQTQVLIHFVGTDQFTRLHLPVLVP